MQRKQAQTANLAAFQTEMQANVVTAGAEALGKMNSSINNGFSPSNIMSGMIMGQAISQNVANSMNTIMMSNEIPPVINESSYYVAINGKSEGPYTISVIKSMLQSGNISLTTLVWKKGMQAWTVITDIAEFNLNINDEMPPIPE